VELWAKVQEIVTSVPFVFLIAVIIAVALYRWGGRISAKAPPIEGKLASYACGEELSAEKIQVDLQRFFAYCVYFMIFDILAFMLATSLSSPGLLPATFAFILLLAVVMLLPLVGRR